jgi:hypothetical protein
VQPGSHWREQHGAGVLSKLFSPSTGFYFLTYLVAPWNTSLTGCPGAPSVQKPPPRRYLFF